MADELAAVPAAAVFESENPLAEGAGPTEEMQDLQQSLAELEEQLASKTETIQRMERMAALEEGEQLVAYEKEVRKKDLELESIQRDLYIDSKAHPSKKQRSAIGHILRDLAEKDGMHESPNTVKHIMDLERRSDDQERIPGEGPVRYVWAFVFDMPFADEDRASLGRTEEQEMAAEHDNLQQAQAAAAEANAKLRVSHEAWMACENIVGADLCLRHAIPIDGKRLIIAIGATHQVLVDEASEMKLLMRMQESKGAIEFHEDLLHYYCSNHGGLNEYVAEAPPGVEGYGEGFEGLPSGYHTGFHLQPRNLDDLTEHWKHDEQLTPERLAVRMKQNEHVFTSALAQRLVMNRLNRLGRYSPDSLLQLGDEGKGADMKSLKHVVHRSVLRHRDIPASMLSEMLTLFGGFRPANAAVFPTFRGMAAVSHLAKTVHHDDQFILKPSGFESHRMKSGQQDHLTYDDVCDCVQILERWKRGKGRHEVWFGTLRAYFPLHQESELVYLKREWGNPKMLFKSSIVGYLRESEPGEEGREMNTFGSCGKERRVFKFPYSLIYQPLEEIRDYFGDDVGLYFAWLGQYTKSLGMMSITGVLVMLYQPVASADSGCKFFGCGVSHNPFTIYYSIYVGIWSTLFIESWNRTENELRFLWGTESLSQIEEPRPSFIGELHTNPETGKQVLEVKSPATQAMKLVATSFICMLFILFTIGSAITAQMVRYIAVGTCRPVDGEGEFSPTGQILSDDCTGAVLLSERECTDTLMTDAECTALLDTCDCANVQLEICDAAPPLGCSYEPPSSIWEQKRFEIISSLLNLSIIGIYGLMFESLAEVMTEWENHRTQSEFDNSRVLKNFLFQFVNNYFVLFYIAYLREIEDPISNASHPCHDGNCLPELQMQLIIVFSGKTLGKQIAYTMKPFVFKWKAQCQANAMTKSIIKASAKGTGMLPASMQTAIGQLAETTDKALGADDPRGKMKELKKMRNPYELQARLMPYEGTFNDFNDRVIQFGYLVLFAPAFPLAPFLAFVNNVIEIRTSGFKMCFAFQRPKWKARAGIGSWLAVLNVLGFLACVTNATMITFVGDQDAKSQLLCPVSTTMSGLEDQPVTYDDVCPATNNDGVPETCNYGCNGLMKRGEQWALWLQFSITEHCVLLLRVIILAVLPSMPKWIIDAREVLDYRKDHRYRTAEDIAEERRLHEEYAGRMKDSFAGLRKMLAYKTEDDLRLTFRDSDPVRNSTSTALHCTALHCTALHCTALHCTAHASHDCVHYTTLHYTSHMIHDTSHHVHAFAFGRYLAGRLTFVWCDVCEIQDGSGCIDGSELRAFFQNLNISVRIATHHSMAFHVLTHCLQRRIDQH
jgi:hypothetical protein